MECRRHPFSMSPSTTSEASKSLRIPFCLSRGGPNLLFDEVQNLPSWAPQIKHLVDNHDVRALITGSSSLRIESGRDSLAGRITTFDLGALLLREIAAIRSGSTIEPFWKDNGLESLLHPDLWREANHRGVEDSHERLRASREFSRRGAYPIAHDRADVRDEKLLEEVFRLCCRYAGQAPGQSVFVPEIQQALAGNVGWNRILNYLRF